MSMQRQLNAYIRISLCSDIEQAGRELYEHISLVDWQPSTSTVTLLICGLELQTRSQISRDVLIDGFCKLVVEVNIMRVFDVVCEVDFLRSWDEAYDEAVMAVGGELTTPDFWCNPKPFEDCVRMYGDNHPCIQGFSKSFVRKPTYQSNCRDDDYMQSSFTTPKFLKGGI